MADVTVHGLRLNYRDTGGDFPPVVLVHGFTGNVRNWALTVRGLRDRYRFVSFDLPGHGDSDKPGDPAAYDILNMANLVFGAMQELGLEKPTLIGHSMGGMVSQYIALDHQDSLRALVLVDTAAEAIAVRPGRLNIAEARDQIREKGIEFAFDMQLKANPDAAKMAPEFVQMWREQFLMTSADAYLACSEAMMKRPPLLPRLHEITIPTLVICGENDDPFLEPSKHMHEAIAGSELAIIEGAGHGPTFETPDKFNAVLGGFLDRIYATTAA